MKDRILELAAKHIPSFVKTYLTVLVGILLFADAQGQDIFSTVVLITSAKAALISVLRNAYKYLTEDRQ